MTTKEFIRRRLFFRALNDAAHIFNLSRFDFIFHCIRLESDLCKYEFFVAVPFQLYSDSEVNSCLSLYYDRFTHSDFETQFKFFVAFYNRCSDYQKSILKSDPDLKYLISRFDDCSE